MENGEFKIRTYGFGELAQLYMPHITPKSASNRLRAWINHNSNLSRNLELSGHKKGSKILTPQQVKLIVEHVGLAY